MARWHTLSGKSLSERFPIHPRKRSWAARGLIKSVAALEELAE